MKRYQLKLFTPIGVWEEDFDTEKKAREVIDRLKAKSCNWPMSIRDRKTKKTEEVQ